MYIYIMYIYVYNRHGLHIYIYKYIHTQKYWSLLRVRKICSQKIIISSLRFKFDFFLSFFMVGFELLLLVLSFFWLSLHMSFICVSRKYVNYIIITTTFGKYSKNLSAYELIFWNWSEGFYYILRI